MGHALILLFNHRLTAGQEDDARKSLGVSRVLEPPEELQECWANVPPSLAEISAYLEPVKQWLAVHAAPGDYLLIQGDFGATYLMVNFAFENGFVPIYSTSEREATEELQADGSLKLTHRFQHRRFRKYGK
jgi:hypothetical protein